MKKLLVLCALIPCGLIAQKKNTFFYVAPGYFAGSNSNNLFMPAIGGGVRNKVGAFGASLYYTTKYSVSANLDIRAIHSTTKSTDPFILIQPGISFYRKSNANTTT